MCGINGLFAYSDRAAAPDREEVRRTSAAQRLRGPDGEGFWADASGRCLLGHRRLSIIDLSDRGLQPMRSADRRYTIVFNGEIYNYPELRAAALAAGHYLSSDSDTEILLHLYAHRGSAMLDALRGMFAFAIWDDRTRTLFAARDPLGIKPLYYSDAGGTFRFASQVRALMAGGAIDATVDPAAAVGFLLLGSVPEPFTWRRAIAALPAGHHLTVDAGGVGTPVRYADPAAVLAAAQHQAIPRAQAIATGTAAVRDSVRAHLLADVPVGLFLSSGIDSAAILGMAREAQSAPMQCVTLGFEDFVGTAEDEVPLAARIAAHYGADHHVHWITRDEFVADLDALLDAMDQPSIDGINSWFVAKAARAAGLKVAMSGIGGDELFGGYPSFTTVPSWHRRLRRIAGVPGLGNALAAALRVVRPGLVRRQPKLPGLFRHAATLGGAYFVQRALQMPDMLRGQIDRDILADGLQRLDLTRRMNAPLSPRPASDGAAVSLLELAFYARNQLLRDADWAGMAHSVEIRTPLLDFTLFGALAPLIGQLGAGEGKQLLADAPARPLPDWLRYRPKTGFNIPYRRWIDALAEPEGKGALDSKGHQSRRWARYVMRRYAAGSARIDVTGPRS